MLLLVMRTIICGLFNFANEHTFLAHKHLLDFQFCLGRILRNCVVVSMSQADNSDLYATPTTPPRTLGMYQVAKKVSNKLRWKKSLPGDELFIAQVPTSPIIGSFDASQRYGT